MSKGDNRGRPGYDQAGRRLLTREEEVDLSNRFIKHGDIEARNRLVVANSGLAYQFARKEANRYDFAEVDDLVQEAYIGIMRACDKFRPELGYRFSTYCCYWIRAKISRRILVLMKEYNLPVPGADMEEDQDGRRSRPRSRTISVEEEISTDDGDSTSLSEIIAGSFVDQETYALQLEREMRIRTVLNEIYSSTKDPRVKVIIVDRLLTDDPVTLDDLGYLCGVSREGARLIEKKVVALVKKRLNY